MWFFVFSINFARTREGRPARRKLTELLVKSKKTLVTEPAAIFFVFQVNISCKTTSIILYFKYASFSVVTRKKRQNTNPHPDGNFFDDRFGLGILRDAKWPSINDEEKIISCSGENLTGPNWAFLSFWTWYGLRFTTDSPGSMLAVRIDLNLRQSMKIYEICSKCDIFDKYE